MLKSKKVSKSNKRALAFAVRNKFRGFPVLCVNSIVTGDVVELTLDLGFGIFKKERISLSGITAPSIRTKSVEEKQLGDTAKLEVDRMLHESDGLECVITGKDKLGRYAGVLFDNTSESVNEQLLNGGFVWPSTDAIKNIDMLRVLQGSEF